MARMAISTKSGNALKKQERFDIFFHGGWSVLTSDMLSRKANGHWKNVNWRQKNSLLPEQIGFRRELHTNFRADGSARICRGP